jgi:putative transposase
MRYSQYFNRKKEISGHLWQGRFYSCILDERHVYAAVRYVENNPIRAGQVVKPEDYKWSNARYHIKKKADEILSNKCYLLDEVSNWRKYLKATEDEVLVENIRENALTGRPCGDKAFIKKLERKVGGG